MISVIVPVYNIEGYIEKCIDSILNQTYQNFELLLIDDGSTDKSGVICDLLEKKDSRIKVFHKENGGVSSARNLGLMMAKGKYISIIDGDDWIEKNLFEDSIDLFNNYDIDVLMFEYYVDGDDFSFKHTLEKSIYCLKGTEQALIDTISPNNRFAWSKIFKRCLLNDTVFNENIILGEDTLFISEIISKTNKIYYTDVAYYHYVQRQNSAVRSNFKIEKLSGILAYSKLLELCVLNNYLIAEHYARAALVELVFELCKEAHESKYINYDDVYKDCKKCMKGQIRKIFWSKYVSVKIKIKCVLLVFFKHFF